MHPTVVVANPDSLRRREWISALAADLPRARVLDWDECRESADYGVGWGVTAAQFAAQPGLRAFLCAGAGADDVLQTAQVPMELPILRVEDAGMGEQMADYCSAAVLGWFTRRADYGEQQRRHQWQELQPARRQDWPIGIFGLGSLGRVVEQRFRVLGFPVHGYTRRSAAHSATALADFLRGTRVLVLMAPLTNETRGLFDRATLAQLQDGAYVINVARGALLVESALLSLLDSGAIEAAALDVFDQEPLSSGHPYWAHPRISVTPHSAACTVIDTAARQLAEKLRLLESGTAPEQISGYVSRQRGY